MQSEGDPVNLIPDMHVNEDHASEEGTGVSEPELSTELESFDLQAHTGTDEYLPLYDNFPPPPGFQWPAHIPAEIWASLPCRLPTIDDLEMDNIFVTSGSYAHYPPSPRLLDENQVLNFPPELLEEWALGMRGTFDLDIDPVSELMQVDAGASSSAPLSQDFFLFNSYLDLHEGMGELSLRDLDPSASSTQVQAQNLTPEFEEGSSRYPLADSRLQNQSFNEEGTEPSSSDLASTSKSVDKGKGKGKQKEEDPDA